MRKSPVLFQSTMEILATKFVCTQTQNCFQVHILKKKIICPIGTALNVAGSNKISCWYFSYDNYLYFLIFFITSGFFKTCFKSKHKYSTFPVYIYIDFLLTLQNKLSHFSSLLFQFKAHMGIRYHMKHICFLSAYFLIFSL